MKSKNKITLAILLGAASCAAVLGMPFCWAANSSSANECASLVQSHATEESIQNVQASFGEPFNGIIQSALTVYNRGVKNTDPRALAIPLQVIYDLVGNPEEIAHTRLLDEFLKTELSWEQWLKMRVPERLVSSRVATSAQIKTVDDLKTALGYLSHAEMLEKFVGAGMENVSGSVDPSSLLGQYLQKTGAQFIKKKYPVEPGGSKLGPERLWVAVSGASMPVFETLFAREGWFSVFAHAYTYAWGKVRTYQNDSPAALNALSVGKILPMVMLSSFEASRLELYTIAIDKYAHTGWESTQNRAKYPWGNTGYCDKPGRYTNCTQWIGNMPLGEILMKKYWFPSSQESRPVLPPIEARLSPVKTGDPLIDLIWKAPGNMQFAEMIGQKESGKKGNFTNPGWVVQTLIGPTRRDRVPVVFIFVEDHQLPIDPNIVPIFETPM